MRTHSKFRGRFLASAFVLSILAGANAAPIDIGSRRELFVDRALVDQLRAATLEPGVPIEREVALRSDRPWDGVSLFVWGMFEKGGMQYLYYRGQLTGTGKHQDDQDFATVALASSRDGIHWEKPNLGRVNWAGATANNLVETPDGGPFRLTSSWRLWFFLDPRPSVPDTDRIKAMVFPDLHQSWFEGKPIQAEIWASGDGVRFHRTGMPVHLNITFPRTVNAVDGFNVFWSEAEHGFVGYFRWFDRIAADQPGIHPQFRGGKGETRRVRSLFTATSPDLSHWSETVPMSYGGTPREEIYEAGAFPYFRAPHQYIALATRFFANRKALDAGELARLNLAAEHYKVPVNGVLVSQTETFANDCNDLVLMAARPHSGTFTRLFMEAFLRPGTDPGNWTSRNNYSAAWIYQTGPAEMSFLLMRHFRQPDNYFRRFSLRLDGFSSLHASYGGGEMVTVPLIFSGNRLELNYSTSAAGQLQIEMEDEEGNSIPGYTLADSAILIGDRIAGEARWKSGADLGRLRGRPVRLRVAMRDADLYSFRFHFEVQP